MFKVGSHAKHILLLQCTDQWANLLNLVPRVSPALPEWERRDPGKGRSRASWTIENIRGVLSNQEICWVELCRIQSIMLRQPLPLMFNSSLLPAISNNIYSNINLKVKQVCLEFTMHMVVMLLWSYQLDIWKVSHISSSSFVVSQ